MGEIGMCNCGIMGPLRLAGGGNGFLGPQECHLSENIMRKLLLKMVIFVHDGIEEFRRGL